MNLEFYLGIKNILNAYQEQFDIGKIVIVTLSMDLSTKNTFAGLKLISLINLRIGWARIIEILSKN